MRDEMVNMLGQLADTTGMDERGGGGWHRLSSDGVAWSREGRSRRVVRVGVRPVSHDDHR
jgi:hypothetical protein